MISNTILAKLIFDQDFMRRVIPFLKREYFEQNNDQITFKAISEYIQKYNAVPSKEALVLSLSNQQMTDEQEQQVKEQIESYSEPDVDIEWLTDETEKFCKDRAVYLAIMDSIQIMDKKDGDEGQIPELLSNALGVSFDTHIGHDFFMDAESRFDFYTEKEDRIPFDLEYLNKITKGGVPRKTLNMILAGTGVGKSLCMCHMAAHMTHT